MVIGKLILFSLDFVLLYIFYFTKLSEKTKLQSQHGFFKYDFVEFVLNDVLSYNIKIRLEFSLTS